MQRLKFIFIAFLFLTLLAGCAKPPPRDPLNACKIFREYPSWYWDALNVKKRWKIPLSVQLAIIYQESRFHADARPPRERFLGLIPWKRPTSADGYAQAVNNTWQLYLRDTGQRDASRTNFTDAVDFIGWYANYAHYYLGISRNNAYALYLAYHEGVEGYRDRTYLKKPWLMRIARSVQYHANAYRWQLRRCRKSLPKKPWWRYL